MRRTVATLACAAVLLAVTPGVGRAGAAPPATVHSPTAGDTVGGYTPPPFGAGCVVHRFGEGEWPPVRLWFTDPLCVEYEKRDITADNGGALRFLLAEPSRFALAATTCRYWQQDHWSVQRSRGATPLVAWDGSYWFDRRARLAALRLTNFRVAGRTAGVGDVVAALADDHPELARALARYGASPGETGLAVTLPRSPWCGTS
ncbi:hypothetical protein AB0873_21565 [Micromonospora sp. NPDC047707]|uniref:hypothetical protein n=1 Tax=Micromonospora sp. NPDC047707 TaxID=3154498 RepID=UPI0034553CDE